ncbi:MAG: FimB/Mfa2 family fimbrial subunit [Odoribacter sp.]|nr:FimB/Mfa2 family fimbrial subunit [Odoribacter sp.]
MKVLNNKIKILITIFGFTIIFILSCNKENSKNYKEEEAVISLLVRAASNSINTDNILWEDRVDELRMLVFDPTSGDIVFNQKLYFPNGFDEASRAVRLTPGTYNFYFIANETVYTGNFVTALEDIQNVSEFTTDTRFTTLPYNPDFVPTENTESGRFVMSAIYNNVAVTGGGTETNPVPLQVSTGRIELIRALAKVEVIFWKKVAGSNVPENTITSVLLEDVASYLSVPPLDNYYTGAQTDSPPASLAGLDYDRDSIGAVTFYIPEFLIPEGSTDYTILEINNQPYPIQNDTELSGIALQRRTVPTLSTNSVIRNYHYIINAYIDAEGGLQLQTYVLPWSQDTYYYIFQGDQ